MSRVALYSPEPARGWLPWIWLVPILMILFNAVPVIALDDWMEARQWSTPRGDPIGLPGLHALLWIGFVPTLLLVLAWVRFVERRSLASIGLVGPAPLKTFAQGLAIGMGTIALVVSAIWAAGGLRATGWGLAWQSPQSLLQVALLLPGFMLQSSVEEVMFRGWMQSVLARKAGVAVAVVLLATGFELPVTGIDAQLPALLVALQPSGVDALTGGAEGPEGSYLCSVFFILAIARIGARRTGRGSR